MKKHYLFALSLILAIPAFTEEAGTNLTSQKTEKVSSEIVAVPQKSPAPAPTKRAAEAPADTSKELGTQPEGTIQKSPAPMPQKRAADAPAEPAKELGTQPEGTIAPKPSPQPRPQQPAKAPSK